MSAMWISIGTGFKTSITNNIELFVNAQLAMASRKKRKDSLELHKFINNGS